MTDAQSKELIAIVMGAWPIIGRNAAALATYRKYFLRLPYGATRDRIEAAIMRPGQWPPTVGDIWSAVVSQLDPEPDLPRALTELSSGSWRSALVRRVAADVVGTVVDWREADSYRRGQWERTFRDAYADALQRSRERLTGPVLQQIEAQQLEARSAAHELAGPAGAQLTEGQRAAKATD